MIDEHTTNLLRFWPIGAVLSIEPASAGSINQTLLVTCAAGRYALRRYRKTDRAWVEREHALIAFAHSSGLPAIGPLPLIGGDTVLERAGRLYALFPFAPGHQVSDHELDDAHIDAMGTFLATMHLALANYPHHRVARREMVVDVGQTIAAIDRYTAIIEGLPEQQRSDQTALERLKGQRAWVEQEGQRTLDELATLEQQPIHGDYTHTNLFFGQGRVCAVIDWDQAYLAPRAWEVIRTLDYVVRFDAERSHRFVSAYRRIAPLPLSELEIAARCYSLMRGHDTWMYGAIYERGNDRLRRFIRPGSFLAIEDQWQAVRPHIKTD